MHDNALLHITDRLARSSDSPVVQKAAKVGFATGQDAKQIVGRIDARIGKKAARLAGHSPRTRLGRAVVSLSRVNRAARSTLLWDYANGRVSKKDLTTPQRVIVSAIDSLVAVTGRMLEAAGAETVLLDGTVVPFKRTGRWPRLSTPQALDILASGDGVAYDAMVEAYQTANPGMKAADVRKAFDKIRSRFTLSDQTGSMRRINAEFAHLFENTPPLLVHPKTGAVVELLELNPARYVRRLRDTTASWLSFRKNFGSRTDPESLISVIEAEAPRMSGQTRTRMAETLRLLNGLPADQSYWTAPGSALHQVGRAWSAVVDPVLRGGVLAMTAVQNVFEPMGNIAAAAGNPANRRMLRAVWRATAPTERNATQRAWLESLGAVETWVRNHSFDPNAPASTISRWVSEAEVAITREAWRWQERMAAEVGYEIAQSMKAGKGHRRGRSHGPRYARPDDRAGRGDGSWRGRTRTLHSPDRPVGGVPHE
ncbi:MAG: hypothetical protein HC834_01845 [Rhodospirillales bacterium]|nr:hypothetical protein [Rhodospirillales bacterium]